MEIAEKLGCRKFVTPRDIVSGESRLNFLFMATLFDNHMGLDSSPTRNTDELQKEIEKYKSDISRLEGKIRKISEEFASWEKLEREKEELEEKYKLHLEAKSNEYENAIEDLKASMD